MPEEKRRMPPVSTETRVIDQGCGIYELITPPGMFHEYLVLGSEKAALIDTGIGFADLKAEVEKLTSLPVLVLNTHGHPDHAGGNAQFDAVMIHPDDIATAESMATKEFRIEDAAPMLHGEHPELMEKLQPTFTGSWLPLTDRQEIDLGGRTLTVFFTPGHTKGSVMYYEAATGFLFAGDTVQPNVNIVEPVAATAEDLKDALTSIGTIEISRIFCGHGMPESVHSGRKLFDDVLAAVTGVVDGTLQGTPAKGMHGIDCIRYTVPGVSISTRADNIRRS